MTLTTTSIFIPYNRNYKRKHHKTITHEAQVVDVLSFTNALPPSYTDGPAQVTPRLHGLHSGGHAQSAQLGGASNILPSCTERRCSFSAASRATPDPRPPSITAGKVLDPDKRTYYTRVRPRSPSPVCILTEYHCQLALGRGTSGELSDSPAQSGFGRRRRVYFCP
jgi:hypothetical protein